MAIALKDINKEVFGILDGQEVYLFTLTNLSRNSVSITNYGGIITAWNTSDKYGKRRDIVLGFDNLEAYLKPHPYFGAIAGRYANRIAHGQFKIDEETYQVTQNEGFHHLHGGANGFDKVIWNARTEADTLILNYTSPDGEEGYPGNLETEVRYSFDDDNALKISYTATTDQPTVVNLTSHSYFNLTGNAAADILNHSLTVNADHYIPVTIEGIATGEILPVKNSLFDFTTPRKIGRTNSFVAYDHCFVLNDTTDPMHLAASLSEEKSGLKLQVFTTEPGMQLYTGIYLDGSCYNKTGEPINRYSGLCLETQHFPDAPNQDHFPSTLLKPEEIYTSVTVYKLDIP